MSGWKLPSRFNASARLRQDGRVEVVIGKHMHIISQRDADALYADLMAISRSAYNAEQKRDTNWVNLKNNED